MGGSSYVGTLKGAEAAPLAHVRAGCSVEHLDTVLPLIYPPGIADAKI